jgi:hypothetical protein
MYTLAFKVVHLQYQPASELDWVQTVELILTFPLVQPLFNWHRVNMPKIQEQVVTAVDMVLAICFMYTKYYKTKEAL